MPQAARRSELSLSAATAESFWDASHKKGWSGDLHGQVGAMHRDLEQRLLAGSFDMAVIPLSGRPLDAVLARVSRGAGWIALAGGFAGVAAMMAALLG